MKFRLVPSALALLMILLPSAPAADDLQVKPYRDWPGSIFLYSPENRVQAVIAPAVGGRLVRFSLGEDNILLEHESAFGKTTANTTTNFTVGGYQCDLGPEIRGLPDHQNLWQGSYHSTVQPNNLVRLSSETNAATGIVLEKEILMAPDTGDLGLVQRMRNAGQDETHFCLWDRTLVQGGGFALVPLNPKSRFKARWSMRRKNGQQYSYDGDAPASTQVKILGDVLIAQAVGDETKLGADSDAGWIAYARGRMLFVKYFPVTPKANYSDGGNTVELYFNPRFAELEPLSPEVNLKPGEKYEFPEKWILIPLEKEAFTFEAARKLVKKIPPSPFRPR